MSVQTEIDRISTAVQNAHLKVIAKGGTSAAPYLVANLPDAIDTIPEATEPKLQAKTATPSETAQTVKPDSGFDGLSSVSVGAISKTYVGSGVTKQAAKTITPSTSSQTAVASGVYTTGAVTVAAIPSTYVKPTATKAAATYTPSTSNQTIAAGTYCSGAQTIKGDANLVAGNIKSGVSIFGVAGTMTAGEDVTAETNTYTDLLTDLEAAVDALPDAGGGSGGGVETCTVTIVQKWGGNDDPAFLTLYVPYYNILADGSIEHDSKVFTSNGDFEPQHSVTVTVYKNTTINVIAKTSLASSIQFEMSANGGTIVEQETFEAALSSRTCFCTLIPTSEEATFTFESA